MTAGAKQSRWWIVGGALVAVLLAAGSWLMLIGPKLDDADSVRAQTDSASQQNAVLQAKVDQLRQDSAGMPDLLRQLATLHTQLPTTGDLDGLTRQLSKDADRAGVTLTSIVIGVPAVVQSQAPAPAPTTSAADPTADEAAGTDGSAAGTAAPTSTAPAGAAPSGATNLYSIPVTVVATGPLADQRTLLDAIHAQGPRGALVSSVQFAPAPEVAGRSGGEPGDAQPSGATDTSGATSTSGSNAVRATGSGGAASAAGAAPATSTSGVQPGGAAAADRMPVTMTVQMAVFVAPQTPDDEAALREQLGG
jgi:hypothetical protein